MCFNTSRQILRPKLMDGNPLLCSCSFESIHKIPLRLRDSRTEIDDQLQNGISHPADQDWGGVLTIRISEQKEAVLTPSASRKTLVRNLRLGLANHTRSSA